MVDLEQFKLRDVPPTVYYVPDFITEAEEKILLEEIKRTPAVKWTQLAHRRLQNWGGIPDPKGMISEDIPPWLQKYVDKVDDLKIFGDDFRSPNHVLLNEYTSGQGIMPHFDGPLFYPTISTISLGSHAVLDYYNPIREGEDTSFEARYFFSLLIKPRSLLIVKDDLYHKYLHGIKEITSDVLSEAIKNLGPKDEVGKELQRGTRISLTIRNVPKKLKVSIFGRKRT